MQVGGVDADLARYLVGKQALRRHSHRDEPKRSSSQASERCYKCVADCQKFIPAINTGVAWPSRRGKASASKKAPFSRTPRPLDSPRPTDCFAAGCLACSQTDPVS